MRILSIVAAAVLLGQAATAALLIPTVTTQGQSVTYEYTVQNDGPSELIQLRLMVPVIPDEVLFPEAWLPGISDSGGMTIVEWNAIGDGIAIGASLGGFGIRSLYTPVLVGFDAAYANPDLPPESGSTDGPGGSPVSMPEPSTFGVALTALTATASLKRRH